MKSNKNNQAAKMTSTKPFSHYNHLIVSLHEIIISFVKIGDSVA